MSRLVLYLARTLEPPPVNAMVDVYGLQDNPVQARVVAIDPRGVTVELSSDAHGCRTWHIDLPLIR